MRTLFAQTMPARLITATSDVPPPMSTIMLPEGSVIGSRRRWPRQWAGSIR